MARQQNVWRVASVDVHGVALPVRFKLIHSRKQVRCAAPGKPPFTLVFSDRDKVYCAIQRGAHTYERATTPQAAFALGVTNFWRPQ